MLPLPCGHLFSNAWGHLQPYLPALPTSLNVVYQWQRVMRLRSGIRFRGGTRGAGDTITCDPLTLARVQVNSRRLIDLEKV